MLSLMFYLSGLNMLPSVFALHLHGNDGIWQVPVEPVVATPAVARDGLPPMASQLLAVLFVGMALCSWYVYGHSI